MSPVPLFSSTYRFIQGLQLCHIYGMFSLVRLIYCTFHYYGQWVVIVTMPEFTCWHINATKYHASRTASYRCAKNIWDFNGLQCGTMTRVIDTSKRYAEGNDAAIGACLIEWIWCLRMRKDRLSWNIPVATPPRMINACCMYAWRHSRRNAWSPLWLVRRNEV